MAVEFVREGYWVRTSIDGEVLAVYRADPDYHDFVYNTKLKMWVELENSKAEFGVDDDYEKVTEEEALEALGLSEW